MKKATIIMCIIAMALGCRYFFKYWELESNPDISKYEVIDYSLKSEREGFLVWGTGSVSTKDIYMISIKTERGVDQIKCDSEDIVIIYDLKSKESSYLKEFKSMTHSTFELHLSEDDKKINC